MLTLAEAAKLSNDLLVQGVFETLSTKRGLMSFLPFDAILGNALTYNRQNVAPSVDVFASGDTWTESTPTFTQKSLALKIAGGDSDTDNFVSRSYSNVNDYERELIELKALALRDKFEDLCINGSIDGNAKQFDGLKEIIGDEMPAAQTISMGTNGAALSFDKLDELIDLVRGRADALIMSRQTRRYLNVLARAANFQLDAVEAPDNLGGGGAGIGARISMYDGIPIILNDFCSNTETQGSSSLSGTIYAVRFGGDGLVAKFAPADTGRTEHGIIGIEQVGALETKDASRWRVKMYVALAAYHEQSMAQLIGINVS